MAGFLKEDTLYSYVIAIDFGTGASGYGITPRIITNEKSRIDVFNPCDNNDDQKTSTAILFDNNECFIDFGAVALQKYAEMVVDGQTALLFQNYKMVLYHMQNSVKSLDGREMPLMKVISETLRYIAESAINKLHKQIDNGIKKEKIRWVLTVPALWNEEHKLFMRKAAVKAGIIEEANSSALFLCLEPEGASIQCRQDCEDSIRAEMIKGKIIAVLDCGGGTVDITVHKLMSDPHENFLCEEVVPSSGGCEWGSKYVDLYFEEFLKEFLGEQLYSTYQKNAIARLEIIKYFEMLKRKFNPGEDDRSRMQFSYLSEELSQGTLGVLIKKYNETHPPNYHLKQRGSSCIDLPPDLMISFFRPLFEKIKGKVKQIIDDTIKKTGECPRFIFMIGGFSESPYLKHEIKSSFEKQGLTVLVPTRPQISVIRGACMFGLSPRSISSRIVKKTYGINTLTLFDPERHPESKKVMIDGEAFCEGIFDIFVKKNESINVDQVYTKTYSPVRVNQTIMKIMFYATDKTNVDFINEDGVSQLGELAIDLGSTNNFIEDKAVTVSLLFGATHLIATATNKSANDFKTCEFTFESYK